MTVEPIELKRVPLQGGILFVSVPHVGMGNLLLTDFLLETLSMDSVAAFDHDEFPPVAMIRRGKARFPVRVHADLTSRAAVLRSEFAPAARACRPLARAILEWAHAHGLARVVALDGLRVLGEAPPGGLPVRLRFAASTAAGRAVATAAGLDELDMTVVGGVPAMLLLEGRLRAQDVVTVLAPVAGPLDDARSVVAFARVLPAFAPGLRVDVARLEADLVAIEHDVRALRRETERAAAQVELGGPSSPSMFA